MILLIQGGKIMKKLNKKEISKFTKRYLKDWLGEVNEVSMFVYRLTKEYLINGHYLVVVKPFHVIHKDLQEL